MTYVITVTLLLSLTTTFIAPPPGRCWTLCCKLLCAVQRIFIDIQPKVSYIAEVLISMPHHTSVTDFLEGAQVYTVKTVVDHSQTVDSCSGEKCMNMSQGGRHLQTQRAVAK